MSECIVKLPTTGEIVDLETYDTESLYKMHYREEKYIADLAKQLPAFSKQRVELLEKGYAFIEPLQDCRAKKEGKKRLSKGSSESSIKLVKNRVAKKLKKQQRVIVYEAGVGLGYALGQISKMDNVEIFGCDIYLSNKVLELNSRENIHIERLGIFEHLMKIENNSIDIFYADNVFEHLFPDELEAFFKLLRGKLKSNGEVIVIIPCGTVGPSDISGKFLPMGAKAEGFHVNECSFRENMEQFKRNGFKTRYCTYSTNKTVRCISDKSGILNRFKKKLEPFWAKFPVGRKTKNRIFDVLGYKAYILEKADS